MRARMRGVAVLAGTALAATAALTGAAVAGTTTGQPAAIDAAAAGPVLLSRNRPVTASTASGCCAAKNAVDGKSTTRWASAAGKDPQWIYVDLGATALISRVRLQWDKSCATAYQLQTSTDHATWTSIFSTTSGKGAVEDRTGLSGSGRYLRMLGTKRCRADGSHGYSLQEFDVFGIIGEPTPPTPPGKPTEVAVSFDRATVAWAASTDDVGVVRYDIAAGGRPCGSVAGTVTSGTCTGLNPDTDYAITVTARDAAGNVSPPSPSLTVHTLVGPPPGNPYGDPNLVSMLNGTNLDGWTQSRPDRRAS